MINKISSGLVCMLLVSIGLNAQQYERDIIPNKYSVEDTGYLNVFTINDTLKYFEFYTPYFVHEDIECGVLLKTKDSIFHVKYADESNFSDFDLVFKENKIIVRNEKLLGYMPISLKDTFVLRNNSVNQEVTYFHLNHRVFYKARKNINVKVYQYPSFEGRFIRVSFKKGDIIEEKWSVGAYSGRSYLDIIRNKYWKGCVYGNLKSLHGWFLLYDLQQSFTLFSERE